MRTLSAKEQDLCTYTGVFGFLLTAACAIQHLIFYRIFDYLLPTLMLLIFLFSMVAFGLLAAQKWYAPILVLISAVLSLVNGVLALVGPLFSLIVLLQFVYTATVVIVIYMDQLPKRLKQRELSIREERDEWLNKI